MPNDDKRTNAARRHGRGRNQQGAGQPSKSASSRHHGDTHANAKRSYERYIALARDAASAGDEVESQNYYQHAEHYLRTMRDPEGGSGGHDQRPAADKGLLTP